jgi:hypothetical protein
MSTPGFFSSHADGDGAEQHLDATIAPQWKQEARVAQMPGILLSERCLTIIGRSTALDGRLALRGELIERCVKIHFVKKTVADRFSVPVGHVRSCEIEAES